MSAEESLKIDLMLELITHLLRSVCRFLYAERRRERGDPDPGSIRQLHFGGTPLPPMTDIEVYVHDDELDQDVWKRVFIGGSPKQRICGLKHPNLTSGIHARIRG